jgi:hypothetical protein
LFSIIFSAYARAVACALNTALSIALLFIKLIGEFTASRLLIATLINAPIAKFARGFVLMPPFF